MDLHPRKLDKLKKRLQHVLAEQNLQDYRTIIQKLSGELAIDTADCAAALLFVNQPHLFQIQQPRGETPFTPLVAFKAPVYRTVRYRLDVGNHHGISEEQLLAVLVEESGVDRKRIARVDMRDTHTLVDLPDGMPADIFQLLSEATVGGRRLNIKRIKPNRRKFKDAKRTDD
ncbi:MAG: DbpA RNA binding domain-containing protein [Methylomonas sp.]|nr:DbpA RNA binding domain-containing protein [Methylomonas sp.]